MYEVDKYSSLESVANCPKFIFKIKSVCLPSFALGLSHEPWRALQNIKDKDRYSFIS